MHVGCMWGHGRYMRVKRDTWGCGGTHGSTAGDAEKHGGTGVGGQQDTRGEAVRCEGMVGHMSAWGEHVGA